MLLSVAATPNDADFGEQCSLHNTGQTNGIPDADIEAPEAWDISTGSAEVVVAVLDTGIDYKHPDLQDNIWVNSDEIAGNDLDDDGNGYVNDVYGYDFSDGNTHPRNDGTFAEGDTPRDTFGHGTHVAGTIGAMGDNNRGISGVSPTVSLMPVQFLGDKFGRGTVAEAVAALNYAVVNGADIINASFGGYLGGWGRLVMADAIATAATQDVLVVAAAGNQALNGVTGDGSTAGSSGNNDLQPFYPGSFNLPNVVTVAATTASDPSI